ncbi:DUF3087 domain-containing protein [Shewanella woodyi]|uniref:DUF3087 domain-containing protein n=1 Tax=Shewanella woodyi TaxID=60961 RepID=UPI0007F97704|nr:DUF3087 domain-containing protein [Shewanella woodyi]
MKLIDIDKSRYRKNLNLVSIALVAGLTILSLVFGALLIAAFGTHASENIAAGESTGNFHLNLLGVIFAVVTCLSVMIRVKDSAFMHEVYYVWRLKALHNRIYRRLKSIKAAANNQEINALIILSFYYAGLKQVYFLDNNTLTMSKVEKDIAELERRICESKQTVSLDQFDEKMLEAFN